MDLDNIWGSWLEYQQTDKFQAEVEAQLAKERAYYRPIGRKATQAYNQRNPTFTAMRADAAKHKDKLIQKQHNMCYLCGMPLDNTAEIDHIKPLIKRGTNNMRNLCVVHMRCNRTKAAK